MAESIVDLVEEWQTGFFFLVGMGIVGLLTGAVVGLVAGAVGRFVGLLAGMVLGFLLGSYVLYGR
ncbi:hypothetical protein [Halorussus halobius]|uniref:hypothetical protein n=1 Tax=Halorussus halobius TaxID=1710537 RepID=UPI001091E623|nr:hypothetical protein [Halorussus halobius]